MPTSTSPTPVLGATGSRIASRRPSRGTGIDRDERVAATAAGGVPAGYGAVLSVLTETIAAWPLDEA
jgi:hypothetical protein